MKKQIIFVAILGVSMFVFGFADLAHAAAQPIPGIDISAKKNPGGVKSTIKTGADGSYSFTGLEPGNYDISIHGQPTKSVTVGANGTLSGLAVQGEPVPGVDVILGSKGGELMVSSDLGIDNVGTLPTSRFYFLKEWKRGFSRLITFGAVAKAELELKITNEKAAEALEVEKISPSDTKAIKKAFNNFTKAQERLNARLAKLSDTSENPNVAELIKKVDEKTAKHTALLEQMEDRWKTDPYIEGAAQKGTIGDPDFDLLRATIQNAQDNTRRTFIATVTYSDGDGKDQSSLKQKAEDQIERAGVAIEEANSALGAVSTTRGIWRPETTGGEITVDEHGVEPAGIAVNEEGTANNAKTGPIRLDPTPARISTNMTIERQTPKRDFGDRMKAGLETAGGMLANAKTAFAEKKFGEAYGLARSAEAIVAGIGTIQNDDSGVSSKAIVPISDTTPEPDETKINTNTNDEPKLTSPAVNNLPVSIPVETPSESKTGQTSQTNIEAKSDATIALSSSPNPSFYGQEVVLTASIKSDGGVPTGTVAFYVSGVIIGESLITSSGVATLNISNLAVSTHSITATYLGSATYSRSTSVAIKQTVSAKSESGATDGAGGAMSP